MNTLSQNINPVVAAYEPYFLRILPTGSRVICSQPRKDSDEDYLLLISKDKEEAFFDKLDEDGWLIGGSLGQNADLLNEKHTILEDGSLSNSNLFQSWKRQEDPGVWSEHSLDYTTPPSGVTLNLLITCNKDYFEDFTRATVLAKALNLQNKQDRVTLFEALTRDVWPDPSKKKEDKKFMRADGVYSNTIPGWAQYVIPPESPLNWTWVNGNTANVIIHDEVQATVDPNLD